MNKEFDEFKEYYDIHHFEGGVNEFRERVKDLKQRLEVIPCSAEKPQLDTSYFFWSALAIKCAKDCITERCDFSKVDEPFLRVVCGFKNWSFETKVVIMSLLDKFLEVTYEQA